MLQSIKTSVIAAVLMTSSLMANAQKQINEGTLIYGAEYKESMPGAPSEMKVKFNGEVSKMEIEAGPASIGIFLNTKTETGLVLVDVPVAQIQKAAKMSKADLDEENEAKPKFSDFKATTETQKLLNYTATKYTFKDEKGAAYELWATTEIEIPLNIATSDFKEIKGTILKFTGDKGTFTLKSINEDKVGALSVTNIPSGYEEITYAELKAMKGGG
ncbi:MAG: hypothetical protein K2Q03_00700 [Sphingobacteriaceae bacterium]|nr:hypothetical protein [Sphingobacteriaceae bacterium]